MSSREQLAKALWKRWAAVINSEIEIKGFYYALSNWDEVPNLVKRAWMNVALYVSTATDEMMTEWILGELENGNREDIE